ncbi:MAG TPA: metal-dependent hydrolase [Sphingomicrobium sp.]|nr:metal-dependent hydrolase [Sphingomicrobium sp.]
MDNLTHSLVGALLGRMGLKRLTGRAMPTLVLAANLPDIDVFAPLVTGQQGLVVHRGFTHGVGGLVVLPLVLTALVLAWDRWRPADPPVRPRALLLLAVIGVASHPLLDYLTGYGTRLLEPLSDRWFYGDTLFIVDVWVWIALILGFEWSRGRERAGRDDWHRPAVAVFAAILCYVALNAALTARAERAGRDLLTALEIEPVEVVASPPPIHFWRRRLLWRTAGHHGTGEFDPLAGELRVTRRLDSNRLGDPRLAGARGRSDVEAFLFWSRLPVVIEQGGRAFLGDQRFLGRRTRGSFLIPLDSAGPAP